MSDDLAKLVYEHEQIRQLTKLIATYHQRADAFDWEGWAETFVEDAEFTFEHGFGLMKGKQGILDICKSSMDPYYDLMQHIMINLDFELTGPDTATGKANLIFTATFDETKRDQYYQAGGIYRWTFRKAADGWRIASAYLDFIWNKGNDSDAVFEIKTG